MHASEGILLGGRGMGSISRSTPAGWQRFLAPYYSAGFLTIASYGLARWWLVARGPDVRYSRLFSSSTTIAEKEYMLLLLLGFAVALKYRKRQSLDAWLSDTLTYCKCAVILLTWFLDWRISIYYLLVFLVLYLLFPQPLYRGATAVEQLTPASFRARVEDNPQAGLSWLVEFYAPWSPPCVHLEPVVAELSLKYSSPHLRFGKVDASRWQQLAQQHRVAVYGALPQLPTFIMFSSGKEQGRIPHVFEDGSVANSKIRREDIIAAFALDEFLEGAARAGAATSRKSGGGSTKKKR